MRKILPAITRPGREPRRRVPPSPGHGPRTLRAAGMMRVIVIGFWVVVMSLVWLLPNSMGTVAEWFVTFWFSLIGGLGLWVLHRVERRAIKRNGPRVE